MSEDEKLKNCYRQMYLGMVEKDRRILSEVLDDTFVLVHMTGMRQSKETFIKTVENGTLNYYSADHERIDVDIHDGNATLLGQSIINAAVFGGGRHTWRLQLRLKLVQKEYHWNITEARASTY